MAGKRRARPAASNEPVVELTQPVNLPTASVATNDAEEKLTMEARDFARFRAYNVTWNFAVPTTEHIDIERSTMLRKFRKALADRAIGAMRIDGFRAELTRTRDRVQLLRFQEMTLDYHTRLRQTETRLQETETRLQETQTRLEEKETRMQETEARLQEMEKRTNRIKSELERTKTELAQSNNMRPEPQKMIDQLEAKCEYQSNQLIHHRAHEKICDKRYNDIVLMRDELQREVGRLKKAQRAIVPP